MFYSKLESILSEPMKCLVQVSCRWASFCSQTLLVCVSGKIIASPQLWEV